MAYQGNDFHHQRYPPSEVEEIMEDNGDHGLLTEPTYNFSLLTRQRALIAWVGTGRKNDYFRVCRFYHFLEDYENTLTPEARDRSRNLEFRSLSTSPEADLLQHMFPSLGSQPQPQAYAEPSTSRYTSSESILPATIAITNYLQEYKTDMGTFLREYQEHAEREGLTSSLNHLLYFISLKTGKGRKREPVQMVQQAPRPVYNNQSYEELNNSFNNLYFGPNANVQFTKPPPPISVKQKNNKHLKQTNKLNIPVSPGSPGGPGPSHGYVAVAAVNGNTPKMNGNKQGKAKVNGDGKENLNVDAKKNYAEVAKKHNANKHNTSNSSNNCD